MQIVVYRAEDDTPDGFAFVAHIINEQPGKPGKPWTLGFHPVVFRASSPEAAREKAQSWWNSELEKVASREANRLAQSERMRARKQPTTTPAPERAA